MTISLNVRTTGPDDLALPTFDNTKFTAINTCPTWGLVRYEHHKTVPSSARAMALEAGGACHQAFAAIRYADLLLYGPAWFGKEYDLDFVNTCGRKEFPEGRWESLLDDFRKDSDPQQRAMLMGLGALHSSGFVDDPEDKRRTLTNLEIACMAYADLYRLNYRLPVFSPKHDVLGIEIPIDTVVEIIDDNGDDFEDAVIRFIGRMDGCAYQSFEDRTRLRVQENKTSSRLGSAWENSFETSHQVTGYCVGGSAVLQARGALPLGSFIQDADIYGLAIPLPKTATEYNGVEHVPVTRTLGSMEEWGRYVLHTVDVFNRWKDRPLEAPKFTHSCNRYFRTCPLLPLCASPMEDRLEYWDSLVENKWSPLEEGNE